MEPKPREQYAVVSPGSAGAAVPGTMLKDLVNLTGCKVKFINQAIGMLREIGDLLQQIEALEAERESLETAVLCNGWFNQRGDGRWYVHHRDGDPCPHPEHSGRGRVRKYVSEENDEAWRKAILDYKRLGEISGDLSFLNRRVWEHERHLRKWEL